MPGNFKKWCDGCGNQTLSCTCETCEVCNGSGKNTEGTWYCQRCNGIGKHDFKRNATTKEEPKP